MEAVITALTTTLTPVAFFGIVKDLVPFIGVMVPVALALYFLRKLVKGAGKGKVKFCPYFGWGFCPTSRIFYARCLFGNFLRCLCSICCNNSSCSWRLSFGQVYK